MKKADGFFFRAEIKGEKLGKGNIFEGKDNICAGEMEPEKINDFQQKSTFVKMILDKSAKEFGCGFRFLSQF